MRGCSPKVSNRAEQRKPEQVPISATICWEKGMELGSLAGQKESSLKESGKAARKMAMESGNLQKATFTKDSGQTTGRMGRELTSM